MTSSGCAATAHPEMRSVRRTNRKPYTTLSTQSKRILESRASGREIRTRDKKSGSGIRTQGVNSGRGIHMREDSTLDGGSGAGVSKAAQSALRTLGGRVDSEIRTRQAPQPTPF